ncbi:fungal specific transcription factor domain-containing protein [Colletotrichum incanum]|uniref:Fungal specific transcription factor domain-containing protein n=1 Tax=Colletotrichum incanum TaxID=1573173 RepID=A0A162NTI8_COLIC|nr:fungal specific transcription factor domain-containing protein [Colletotrichum incanum]OHW96202.1 fungal specific transcription factor domain-containing protein [Colletotrichum incanum]
MDSPTPQPTTTTAKSPITRKRKRGRHAVACKSCHRRKQRCNGSRPCFNCERRGVGPSCSYSHLKDDSQRESSRQQVPAQASPAVNFATPVSPSATGVNPAEDPERPDEASASGTIPSRSSSRGGRRQGESGQDQQSESLVGNLFKSRDAPSFFGSSYFGPQAAAKIIQAPAPELSSGLCQKAQAGSTHSFRDEGGPFSQIWELLGLLPRKKSTCDRLTDCFLNELNWAIDAVQPNSFKAKYENFWSRKFGFDDFATIDLRWLALLFIVMAYGVLLDCPKPRNKEVQREVYDTSQRFYWAARRAIVIAPTFYGESTDLVRAGVLVTRYLIYTRRVPESWLTTSFAMRMAQAQGMHIDGERWRLPRKETETRRRLWSNLYMLDKTIALALGRPFAIVDQQCLVKQASNVWLDDLDDEEAAAIPEAPLSEPTASVFSRLAHELAVVVGKIQERCFGLFTVSYETVLTLDKEIETWRGSLPSYFDLKEPDRSKDERLPFLPWQRLHLHSMYHFARVTLHRPFLLRQSITNRYKHSHDVCIASACADLDMGLKLFNQPLNDRLKWSLGPHNLFNSALVLGIIAVRDPHSRRSQAILEDLAAYCEMQRNDVWLNEFAMAEVKIVELCVKKARQSQPPPASTLVPLALASASPSRRPSQPVGQTPIMPTQPQLPVESPDFDPLMAGLGLPYSTTSAQMTWDDPGFFLPESGDLSQWEHVLNTIMHDQSSI